MHIALMKTLQFHVVGFLTSIVLTVGASAESLQEYLTAGQTSYMKGDVESAKKSFQTAYKLDPKNQIAIGFLKKIAADEKNKPQVSSIQKDLEKLIIPKVDFKDATFSSVLDFMKQAVAKNSEGKVNVSFVVQLPEEQAKQTVTLALANAPCSVVLRYLGELTKVDFVYDKYAIVVKPHTGPATADATPPPVSQ